MSKVAFMFPGQGAQYVGMGKDFYETYDTAKKVFELASEVSGLDIADICFGGEPIRSCLTSDKGYDFVMACGADPSEPNVVELGGITVPEGKGPAAEKLRL